MWDYGKGYVDALADAGLDPGEAVDVTSCPWCDDAVDRRSTTARRCGRSLAPLRLYRELTERGMPGPGGADASGPGRIRTLLLTDRLHSQVGSAAG